MIRFSAVLVAVAIGVLVAGIAASGLLLVYVAIATSAVALLVLTIGVALKREELFGEAQGQSAAAAAQPVQSAPAGVGMAQMRVNDQAAPPPLAGAALGPGAAFAVREPDMGQARPAWPSTVQPGTVQASAPHGNGAVRDPWSAAPSVFTPRPKPAAPTAPAGAEPIAPAATAPKAPAGTAPKAPLSTTPKAPAGTAPKAPAGTAPKAAAAAPPAPARDNGAAKGGWAWLSESFAGKDERPGNGDSPADTAEPDAPAADSAVTGNGAKGPALAEAAPAAATKPAADPEPVAVADQEPAVDTADEADAGEAAGAPDPAERDEPEAKAAAEPDGMVRVVRGVPRYHEADCVLIMFMPDEEVQVLTEEVARESGNTPCGACHAD